MGPPYQAGAVMKNKTMYNAGCLALKADFVGFTKQLGYDKKKCTHSECGYESFCGHIACYSAHACLEEAEHDDKAYIKFKVHTDTELADPSIKPEFVCLNVTMASNTQGADDIRSSVHLLYDIRNDRLAYDAWFMKTGGKTFVPHVIDKNLARPSEIKNMKDIIDALKKLL